MKTQISYLLFVVLILFNSCIQLRGLTNDYKYLNESEKKRISKLNHFDNLKDGYIYEVTADQLLEEIEDNDTTLVYTFANSCSGDYCYPLDVIKDFAERNNYELFLIMTGYKDLSETLKQEIDSPLFSVNADHYESKYFYYKRFKKELGIIEYLEAHNTKYAGSYKFFVSDSLVEIKNISH